VDNADLVSGVLDRLEHMFEMLAAPVDATVVREWARRL